TIEDVHEARAILELAAVGRLAKRATQRQVAHLEAMTEEEAVLLGAPYEWVHHALRFHSTLIEFAGLETLAFLSSVIDELIDRRAQKSKPRYYVDGPHCSLLVRSRSHLRGEP